MQAADTIHDAVMAHRCYFSIHFDAIDFIKSTDYVYICRKSHFLGTAVDASSGATPEASVTVAPTLMTSTGGGGGGNQRVEENKTGYGIDGSDKHRRDSATATAAVSTH